MNGQGEVRVPEVPPSWMQGLAADDGGGGGIVHEHQACQQSDSRDDGADLC